eukprot:scaffold3290_cov165-Ochromonas_danica.AAC.33
MKTAGSFREKALMSESKMQQSLRTGHHATVYEVRRDPELKNKDVIRDKTKPVFPFIGGSQYKGEWAGDKKCGFGVQINPDNTKYEGEWNNNMYNGRGTLWVKKGKNFVRVYVGNWIDGSMEGEGIRYYENGEVYKGEWEQGQRNGKGKHEYLNGDEYTGDWRFDMRNGFGTMNYTNGNVFEGTWVDNKKEGPGLFYYASTRKIYEGEWHDDQPRCGEFRSPSQSEEIRFVRPLPKGLFFNDFQMPGLALADPQSVLSSAVVAVRSEAASNRDSEAWQLELDDETKERLKESFESFAKMHHISVHDLPKVLSEARFIIDPRDIEDIVSQLQEKETHDLSVEDVLDIASFLLRNVALSPIGTAESQRK